jgi:hypothetical protein
MGGAGGARALSLFVALSPPRRNYCSLSSSTFAPIELLFTPAADARVKLFLALVWREWRGSESDSIWLGSRRLYPVRGV